jgi:hypothetical protein
MTKQTSARLLGFIAGLGAVAIAIVYSRMGLSAAKSAAVGVGLALVNWVVLRFIVGRVLGGSVRTQARFALLLVVKMAALMAAVLVLIQSGLVEPVAMTIGLSSLAGGAILGSLAHVLTTTPESEPSDAAR